MAKLKGILAVALTILLIFAGAFFPETISCFLDGRNIGNISSNPISSVHFEIKNDISAVGKLAMLSRLDRSIELSENMAKMSKNQVMDAMYEGLRPYIDAQLIDYAESNVEMQPSLMQGKSNQQLKAIVWLVAVSCDPQNYRTIYLVIDDETGNILMLSYNCEDYRDSIFGADTLSVFADIYFTGLDIPDYMEAIVPDMEYAYADNTTAAMRYHFLDVQYGAVNVDLFVRRNGFCVEFPDT